MQPKAELVVALRRLAHQFEESNIDENDQVVMPLGEFDYGEIPWLLMEAIKYIEFSTKN